MSEHRSAIASILLDPRYANTGLTLVELYEKTKGLGLFPTKEHLSKVLSKMHGSNLVKRSIATQTYGSRWSITIKGRDLYRGVFDHTEKKLEMVDVPDVEKSEPVKIVEQVAQEIDEAKQDQLIDAINADGRATDIDAVHLSPFTDLMFKLGLQYTQDMQTAYKASPITNVTQKIEDLKQINEAIKLLTKQNTQVIDDLIAELSVLL